MLELADRHVWGACVAWRTGSSPVTRTISRQQLWYRVAVLLFAIKVPVYMDFLTSNGIWCSVRSHFLCPKIRFLPWPPIPFDNTLPPCAFSAAKKAYRVHLLTKGLNAAKSRPEWTAFYEQILLAAAVITLPNRNLQSTLFHLFLGLSCSLLNLLKSFW